MIWHILQASEIWACKYYKVWALRFQTYKQLTRYMLCLLLQNNLAQKLHACKKLIFIEKPNACLRLEDQATSFIEAEASSVAHACTKARATVSTSLQVHVADCFHT